MISVFKIRTLKIPYEMPYLLFMLISISCTKNEDEQIKIRAPFRSYTITARLDNKQAGTDSYATGILKGEYSEKTKLFTYILNYENIIPTTISINKGTKGKIGEVVINLQETNGITYSSITREKLLTSLEERDLIKGLWFVTIGSAKYSVSEIRGQVTIKQK